MIMPDLYETGHHAPALPEPVISKLNGSAPREVNNRQRAFRVPDDPKELRQLIFMHGGKALVELDRCVRAFTRLGDFESVAVWETLIEALETARANPYITEPKDKRNEDS